MFDLFRNFADLLKGRFYRKSLAWSLVISSFPGIVFGTIMYWIGKEQMSAELQRLHYSQIEKRSQHIDEQLHTLELALSYWAFDSRFGHELVGKNMMLHFEDAWDLSNTLVMMNGASSFAGRIELYIDGDPPVMFQPDYNNLSELPDVASQYRRMLQQKNTAYWIALPAEVGKGGTSEPQLAMIHKIPGNSLTPFGILAVHLDTDALIKQMKALTPFGLGESFLMRKDGQLLLSTMPASQSNEFFNALQAEIVKQSLPNGSLLFQWDHSTFAVSYGVFHRIGEDWIYVTAAPIDLITAPIVLFSKWVIGFGFATLFLACLMSILASKRIYRPIEKLLNYSRGEFADVDDEFQWIEAHWQNLSRESSYLQRRLEEQLTHAKEGFLLQFIQGRFSSYTDSELIERMKRYGWTIDNKKFVILHVHLTGYLQSKRFSKNEEGLVSFAAANIIQEIANGYFEQADMINLHDLTIGLFIAIPVDEDYGNRIPRFTQKLMKEISRILRMQVTVTIGRETKRISEVPITFEEASQAVRYRSFENENQTLDLNEFHAKEGDTELRYPFVLEREIVNRLKTGDRPEMEGLINNFLNTVIVNNVREKYVQQAMQQLLGSIQHTILQTGINPNRLYQGENMFEQLAQIRDPDQMRAWFQESLIAPYIQELEKRNDKQIRKIVEAVVKYIHEHYNEDFSLDDCAKMVGTSSYFLSRVFNKVNGVNFVDYLTQYRMEKAKELLRDTELKINDVAEQVGYHHSYFDRIFKKSEGVTPRRFRDKYRPS